MKIVLCAQDEKLAEAWRSECGDLEVVSIHHGSILEAECDAVVSPANSFGFMEGGIDAVYRHHFGDAIQGIVRRQIREYHHGELPVGNADIVETGNERIPFLIVAPTMRVPMILQHSVNAYLAARAVFILCLYGDFKSGRYAGRRVSEAVDTIAMPGLGTGVGRIGARICADQVRQALNDIVYTRDVMPESLVEATEKHRLLCTGKSTRATRPDNLRDG